MNLRKAQLAVGGILAGALLILELYIGAALVYGWFWPLPPAWPGVLIGLFLAVVGPLATLAVWRSGQRRSSPSTVLAARVELTGIGVGLVSLVALVAMLVVAAPF